MKKKEYIDKIQQEILNYPISPEQKKSYGIEFLSSIITTAQEELCRKEKDTQQMGDWCKYFTQVPVIQGRSKLACSLINHPKALFEVLIGEERAIITTQAKYLTAKQAKVITGTVCYPIYQKGEVHIVFNRTNLSECDIRAFVSFKDLDYDDDVFLPMAKESFIKENIFPIFSKVILADTKNDNIAPNTIPQPGEQNGRQ